MFPKISPVTSPVTGIENRKAGDSSDGFSYSVYIPSSKVEVNTDEDCGQATRVRDSLNEV